MIPDDDASGMRAGHAIGDFSLRGSAISKPIRHMARAACGLPTLDEKKRIFSLF
jgi:hypothetical protein